VTDSTIVTESSRKITEARVAYVITISALYVGFISDGISKLFYYLNYDITRVSLAIRGIYEVLFIGIILLYIDGRRIAFILFLIFLFLNFLTGQAYFASEVARPHFLENVFMFNKYFYVFIIFFAIRQLRDSPIFFEKTINAVQTIFTINSIAILVGAVTGFHLFSTYLEHDYRRGYMGFLPIQNEATLFYFLAISFAYYKRFILGEKSWTFFVIVIASLCLGTKGIYVFIGLLFIFHFLVYSRQRVVLILFGSLAIFRLTIFMASKTGQQIIEYFMDKARKQGFLSMLLSGRDILLKKNFVYEMQHWHLVNFFVGGQDVTVHATEMDFFDLFLFFGVVGSICYMTLCFLTIFKFKKGSPFLAFFIFIYYALAFTGGHFFASAMNALYLCLVTMYFYQTQTTTNSY
jgi:hypothetical protein